VADGRHRHRGVIAGADLGERCLVLALEFLETELLDGVLQAGARSVGPVAHAVEDLGHGLGHQRHVRSGDELVQDPRRDRCGAEAPGDQHLEPALTVDHAGDEAEVVDGRLRPIQLVAGEGDLELAGEGPETGIAEQVLLTPLRVRQHVEGLVRRDAGERVRRHIAHGISAGLAGREPDRIESALQALGVVQFHEMKLDVLPRRDVPETAAEVGGDVGERQQLRNGEQAPGHLDPNHLYVRLTLPVDAAGQPKGPEGVGVDLARFVAPQHLDELVDVGDAGEMVVGLAHALLRSANQITIIRPCLSVFVQPQVNR
jgi:hypothetical protein